MPKYGFWMTEKTVVYKEIEAENADQATEIASDFMCSDRMDWGQGDMDYDLEFDGEITK